MHELSSPNGSDTYIEIRESESTTSQYSAFSLNPTTLPNFGPDCPLDYLLPQRNFWIHVKNFLCTPKNQCMSPFFDAKLSF
jgi:hypothetical protein